MHSMLETFSEGVGVKVYGAKPESVDVSDVGAVNWAAFIELIIQIATDLIANCTVSDSDLVEIVKNPGIVRRGIFKGQVNRQCRSCTAQPLRGKGGIIADAMFNQVAEMERGELLAMVFETQNSDWILA